FFLHPVKIRQMDALRLFSGLPLAMAFRMAYNQLERRFARINSPHHARERTEKHHVQERLFAADGGRHG
ncbi:hypothetical protein, partial [Paenibacillus chibensis]|uniref:hypothetical protein n=1 Tax=Paenibacillus chibensis TaxID=59846 RepID=UPI001C3F91E3